MTKTYAQCHCTHTDAFINLRRRRLCYKKREREREQERARFANDIKALHKYVTSHTHPHAHTLSYAGNHRE